MLLTVIIIVTSIVLRRRRKRSRDDNETYENEPLLGSLLPYLHNKIRHVIMCRPTTYTYGGLRCC